jgi:hypothetical protein
MTGVTIVLASFAIAIIGIFRNNKAESYRAILGLNRVGVLLIFLSVIGVVAGVAKEISSIRTSKAMAVREDVRDVMLHGISAKLDDLAKGSSDPHISGELAKVADQVSQVASVQRRSDFSRSDFSESNFSECLFRNALFDVAGFFNSSFRGASFRGADLRGADLSDAMVDDQTKFPKPR